MKRYLHLLLVAMLAAGLAGCGDNKTKNKLVGTELVGADGAVDGEVATARETASALAAAGVSAAEGVAAMIEYADPTNILMPSAKGLFRATATTPQVVYDPATGEVSYGASGMTVRFLFLDATGSAIISGSATSSNLTPLILQAQGSARKLKVVYQAALGGVTQSAEMLFSYNATGDFDSGGTVSGSFTTQTSSMVCLCTLTGISVTPAGDVTAGTIATTMGGWTLQMDLGSLTGSIAGPGGYTASLQLSFDDYGNCTALCNDAGGKWTVEE